MPNQDTLTYQANGKTYDVPPDRQESFLQNHKDAKKLNSFKVNDKIYDVPDERLNSFLQNHKEAKPLFGEHNEEPHVDSYAPEDIQAIQDKVNAGSETLAAKQQKETAENDKLSGIVSSALNSPPSSKPLKDIGQSQLNDNGSVSYIDESGNMKIVTPHDVDKIMRTQQAQKDIKVRAEGTPMEKAQYAVADYLKSIPTDIVEGGEKFAKAGANLLDPRYSISHPGEWKNDMVHALSGGTQAVMGVAKVLPETAGTMALWTGATEAAQAAVEPLKNNPEFNAQNVYHTVQLLTQPATEVRSWITDKPMGSETEQEIYGLADNIAFLVGAHLTAKGINTIRDIPKPEPVKEGEKPTAKQAEQQQDAERDAKLLEIKNKFDNKKPLEVADLPIVKDLVENSTHEDIKEAGRQTKEKQESEKAAIEKAKADAVKAENDKEIFEQKKIEAMKNGYTPISKGEKETVESLGRSAQDYEDAKIDKFNKELEDKAGKPAEEKPKPDVPQEVEHEGKTYVNKDGYWFDQNMRIVKQTEANKPLLQELDKKLKPEPVKPTEEEKPVEVPPRVNMLTGEKVENKGVGIEEQKPAEPVEEKKAPSSVAPESGEAKQEATETKQEDPIQNIASEYGWTANKNAEGNYEFTNRNGKTVATVKNEKGRNVFYSASGKKMGSDPNLERGVRDLIEKQFYGEKVKPKDEGGAGQGEGEKPQNLEDIDIHQAGFPISIPKRYKDMVVAKAKGLLYKNYFANRFKGIDFSKFDFSQKKLIQSENDVRGVVTKAVKDSGGDIKKFKSILEDYAITADQLSGGEDNTDAYTAWKLATMSDLVHDKASMRDLYKFMIDRPKYNFGGVSTDPRTLEEYKTYEKLNKPMLRSLSYKEKTNLKNAFDPLMKLPQDGIFPDEPTGMNKAMREMNHIIQPSHFYMNNLPENIRSKAYGIWRGYIERVTKGRAYDMSVLHTQIHPSVFDEYTTEDKQKVINTLYRGWIKDGRYYSTDELTKPKAEGGDHELTPEQAGLYNNLQDQIEQYKTDQLETDKARAGYDKMTAGEKKNFDETHRKYLTAKNGYAPFYQYGDHYTLWHGTDLYGNAKKHISFFNTPEKAEAHKTMLKKDANNVGVGKDGERNEKADIKVGEVKRLKSDEIQNMYDAGGIRVIDDIMSKGIFTKGTPEYEAMQKLRDTYYAQAYNPHFLGSSKIPGARVDWNTFMTSLEQMRARGINDKHSTLAKDFYHTEADKLFQGQLNKYRKQYDKYIDDMDLDMSSYKAIEGLYKLTYAQFLWARPAFMADILMHSSQTVYPEIGLRLGELQKQGKAPKGMTAEQIFTTSLGRGVKGWSDYISSNTQKYDTKKYTDLRDIVNQKLKMSGTIGNPYYDQTYGLDREPKDSKTPDRVFGKVMGWGTGQLDPLTRYHAAEAGHALSQYEGLDMGKDAKTGKIMKYEDLAKDPEGNKEEIKRIENDTYKYVSEFLGKTKFDYGKYNSSVLQRTPSKVDNGMIKFALDATAKGITSFANTHINALYLMGDQMRRASNIGADVATKTAARIIAPRLVGGGIHALPYYFAYQAAQALISNYFSSNPQPIDTHIRKKMVADFGAKEGNKYADMVLNGMATHFGLDLKSQIALGELYNNNMPLSQRFTGGAAAATAYDDVEAMWNFAHGDWNKGFMKLPGEAHNLAKAFTYMQLYENKKGIPKGKDRFYYPDPTAITATALGFHTEEETLHQNEKDIEKEFVGDGQDPVSGIPKGGRKKALNDDILNYLQSATPEQWKKINAYQYSRTEKSRDEAFGKLAKEMDKYNTDLHDQLYTIINSEHYTAPDSIKTLKKFAQYGFSSTNKDLTWQFDNRKGTQLNRLIKMVKSEQGIENIK